MKQNKIQKISEKARLSPIFVDTEFVPSNIHYFTLFNKGLSQVPAVLLYPNEQTTIQQLEEQVSRIQVFPQISRWQNQNGDIFSSIGTIQSVSHILPKTKTIKDFKLQACRKRIDGEEVEINQSNSQQIIFDKILNSKALQGESSERCDICLIMMGNKQEVIHMSFRWRSQEQTQALVLEQINQLYKAELSRGDIQLNILTFTHRIQKGEVNIRYIPSERPIKNIKQHIFQSDKLTYIGVNILTSKVSSNRAKQSVVSEIDQGKQHFILISSSSEPGLKIDFQKIKQYQVRQILGILGFDNPQRKGLLVLNQILQPSALLYTIGYIFKEASALNFITAEIVEESDIFFQQISKFPFLSVGQLSKIVQEDYGQRNSVSKRSSLFNQNKKQLNPLILFNSECQIISNKQIMFNLLYHIIHMFIRNKFTHYSSFFDSSISSRFVGSLLNQIKGLPAHKGEAFRKIGYQLNCKEGEVIQFNNFIMASKNKQIFTVNTPSLHNSRATYVTIISQSGRVVGTNSSFEGLEEIIFAPFTKFQVVQRTENKSIIQVRLKQMTTAIKQIKSSIILWLDNTPKQGMNMFNQLRYVENSVILYSFSSTSQLANWSENHRKIIESNSIKIVMITNMRRSQRGKDNPIAGIESIQLVRVQIPQAKIMVYIGNIEYTNQNLISHKIDPKSLFVTNSANILFKKLKEEFEKQEKIENSLSFLNKIQKQDWKDYLSFLNVNQSENPFQLVKNPQVLPQPKLLSQKFPIKQPIKVQKEKPSNLQYKKNQPSLIHISSQGKLNEMKLQKGKMQLKQDNQCLPILQHISSQGKFSEIKLQQLNSAQKNKQPEAASKYQSKGVKSSILGPDSYFDSKEFKKEQTKQIKGKKLDVVSSHYHIGKQKKTDYLL